MNRAQGIIFDIDGTVCCEDQAIPGAPQAIEQLRRHKHPIVFVTNAIESRAEHVEKLARLGIHASPDEIINATMILSRQLNHLMPQATIFAVADPPLLEELGRHFRLSEDPDEIDIVIASCNDTFDYYKLDIAFQALKRGASFWATNADATRPVPGGELPDAGAIIGALKGCSGRKVELISGKPSPLVTEAALDQLDRRADECLIVGDRLETDIAMGHYAGMRTVLVLTGVTRPADLVGDPIQPDHVLPSIAQVPSLFNPP